MSSLKSRIVAVAAANKHTAVVSDAGEVFTWGCNREGQLGYGTSNSASNYTPRLVEYLKGKVFTRVTAAKYHTIVLGVDGEVILSGVAFVILIILPLFSINLNQIMYIIIYITSVTIFVMWAWIHYNM